MTSPRPIPIFDGHNDALLRLNRRESGGGVAAFLDGEEKGHLDLPKARSGGFAGGLFAKAISESGLGFATIGTAAHAQQGALAFAALESPAGNSADALAKLRTLSVDQILADQAKMPYSASTSP